MGSLNSLFTHNKKIAMSCRPACGIKLFSDHLKLQCENLSQIQKQENVFLLNLRDCGTLAELRVLLMFAKS